MGLSWIRPGARVYVDTPVMIYSVERDGVFSKRLDPLWQLAAHDEISLLSSELLIAECLIRPLRSGDAELRATYENAFASLDQLQPVTQSVLRRAAELRSLHRSLKTPDAIHAATSLLHGCDVFLTNDHAIANLKLFPSQLISDLE